MSEPRNPVKYHGLDATALGALRLLLQQLWLNTSDPCVHSEASQYLKDLSPEDNDPEAGYPQDPL